MSASSLSASLQVPPLSQLLCTEVTSWSKRKLMQCLSVSNEKDVITAMVGGFYLCLEECLEELIGLGL